MSLLKTERRNESVSRIQMDAEGKRDSSLLKSALNGSFSADDLLSIYMRNGEYIDTDPVTIQRDFVYIRGENRDKTIIQSKLGSPAVSFTISPLVSSSYSMGQIRWTTGDKEVFGDSTSWLAGVSPGWWIFVGTDWYEIETVDSDVQITLVKPYRGTSASGYTDYIARTLIRGVCFENLTFDLSYAYPALFQCIGCIGLTFRNVRFIDARHTTPVPLFQLTSEVCHATFQDCVFEAVRGLNLRGMGVTSRKAIPGCWVGYNTFKGCTFSTFSTENLSCLYLEGHQNVVRNCEFRGIDRGASSEAVIILNDAHGCDISRNSFYDSKPTAIKIYSVPSAAVGKFNKIQDNHIFMTTTSPAIILGSGCNYNMVDGNLIMSPGGVSGVQDGGMGNDVRDNYLVSA